MAKKKRKVEEPVMFGVEVKPAVEYITPTLGETKVNPNKVFGDVKQEVTPAMQKAQELMEDAVNEVLDGIISKKELLSIAIRKVRATSVLSEEEDDALGQLNIEVKVWF